VVVNVAKRKRRVVRSGRTAEFLNPSPLGNRVLYVAVTRCGQELRIARPGADRVVMRLRPRAAQDVGFDPGHTSQGSRRPCPGGPVAPGDDLLWTTALGAKRALVTLLHVGGSATRTSLVSVRR